MRKLDRGVMRPEKTQIMNIDKSPEMLKTDIARSRSYKTKYFACNPKKWDPPSFLPNLLSNTTPLLDRSNTPRKAKRAITLDRSFDHEPWMHNRF